MTSAPGNSQNRSFTPKRSDGPRKVRHGIKLQGTLLSDSQIEPNATDRTSKPAASSGAQLGRRWLSLVESAAESAQLAAGLEYARSGQVVNIEFQAGAVTGQVQGSGARPYPVQINVPMFTAEQWSQIIDAMADEAVYVAKLLADEWPPGTDELLAARHLSPLPPDAESLKFKCGCAASQGSAHVCKHIVALAHIAAEQIAHQPLVVFAMLGMPAEQVLERLRRVREIQMRGEAVAHATAQIPQAGIETVPLEQCLDDFWRAGGRSGEWEQFSFSSSPHHVQHALLRRLGPPPMNGKFPLVGLLASVYDAVSAAANRAADSAE